MILYDLIQRATYVNLGREAPIKDGSIESELNRSLRYPSTIS